MNKFKDISEFENLLKDTLQGHSTPPPADVWASVSSATAQSAGLLSQFSSFFSSTANVLKVALFAGGIATVGLVVYNETNSQSTSNVTQSDTKEVSEVLTSEIEGKTTQKIEINENSRASNSLGNRASRNTKKATESEVEKNNPTKTNMFNPFVGVGDESGGTSNKSNHDDMITAPANKASVYTLQASDNRPCIGQNVVMNASLASDWYKNNELVAKNTKTYIANCNETGILKFVSKSNGKEATTTVVVSGFDAQILAKEKSEGQYNCSLNQAGLIANWYIDNKLVSTNSAQITANIDQVGTHLVKATVVNHACALPITTSIKLEPIGSFDYTTVFTVGSDGINDTYKVDIEGYDNFSMQIFDPSGKQVFTTLDPENGWNGSVNNNGPSCTAGAYFARVSYKLKGEAPTIKSIKLTLIRP